MKRIWNRAKRIGALTLATVLLAGVLALPASAAADPTYLADWAAIYQRTDDPSEDARALYQHMIQKYPSSPDAYFHYVQYTYVQWWNGREAYQPDEVPQLISYLDTAIRLEAENPENPYTARWGDGPDGYWVEPNGYKRSYTLEAAKMKENLEMWTLGHQEQTMDAVQQELDCWEQEVQNTVTNREQTLAKEKQFYLDIGDSDEEASARAQEYLESYEKTLNETIPLYREELTSLRYWYSHGQNSFKVGPNTHTEGQGTLRVNGGMGDTALNIATNTGSVRIKTSRQIRAIQRTLNGMTIFVPAGTSVSVEKTSGTYYGEGFLVWKDSCTAKTGFELLTQSYGKYNGDYYQIFVVGV